MSQRIAHHGPMQLPQRDYKHIWLCIVWAFMPPRKSKRSPWLLTNSQNYSWTPISGAYRNMWSWAHQMGNTGGQPAQFGGGGRPPMMLMDASQMGTGMDPNSQQMMMFQNPYMQMMHPAMQHQLMSSTSPQAQAQQAQPQAHSPAPPRDQDRRDPSMYMISQVSPQHNSSRMSLPMFKDGDNKLSSSYVWFGAVFRYGQRKSLPKNPVSVASCG